MPLFADNFLGIFRRPSAKPTSTVGVPGVAIYGGYVDQQERDPELSSHESRYRLFADILANASVVSAGVRHFLTLLGVSQWTFKAAEADKDGKYRELAENALTRDPQTSFHRIVRRAAMFRLYGFSVQEWTVRRHEDGHFTFHDVAPRAQNTIIKWDVDNTGHVRGVVQRNPKTTEELYIPRGKLMYVVDDSLNDSPEGLGLFRHLVKPAKLLKRYIQLETFGFETDLRGIPVVYGPFTALRKDPELSDADVKKIEKGPRDFVKNHIRTPHQGLFLDSAPYTTADQAERPSSARQWSVELLRGSGTSFKENAAAIERLNRELARILGVEQLLLGSTSIGSLALSEDKTTSFYRLVDAALTEIKDAVRRDLIDVLWDLNGWPEEMKPILETEATRQQNLAQLAQALRDLATAGATLEPDDPVINDVRNLMGVSPVDLEQARQRAEEMAELEREGMRNRQLPRDNSGNPSGVPRAA